MFIDNLLPAAREKLVTILEGGRLIDAAKLLRRGTDLVIVTDRTGLLVGVVTRTDVVDQLSFCEESSCVGDVPLTVTRDVLSAQPGEELQQVWDRIRNRGIKNIPVVDQEGKALGVLAARDIVERMLVDSKNDVALLRDYVMGVGYR